MPFTPFHMGPGCFIKAVAGNRFSLTVFGFSQIAMDVQPLVHLLRGEGILHGASHTLLGATLIGALSVVVGRPLCQLLLKLWTPDPEDAPFLNWLRGPGRITWTAAMASSFLGTYSHVLLDGTTHADVHPFAPFADENPLLGLVSFPGIHLVCIGTGILGLLGFAIVYYVHTAR